MVERIAWVTVARDQYRKITTYLFENHPEGAIERFDARLEKRIALIKKQPDCGRPCSVEAVRYVVVGGRYRLYYRFQGSTIYLVFLWDNKRNPKKNPYQ